MRLTHPRRPADGHRDPRCIHDAAKLSLFWSVPAFDSSRAHVHHGPQYIRLRRDLAALYGSFFSSLRLWLSGNFFPRGLHHCRKSRTASLRVDCEGRIPKIELFPIKNL